MPKQRATPPPPPSEAIRYRIEIADFHAHLFRVTLNIARPAALQRLALPVWIPGSYLVREFSKNLQGLRARQGTRALPETQLRQFDKCSWEIRCNPDKPLQLIYEVYANDNSVRTACLDAHRGFFNNSSLCLRVEGQSQAPHLLDVAPSPATAGWSVATGLSPLKINKLGFGSYLAADYDELVDCPVEMGPFWNGAFNACGVPHRFVVAGATAGLTVPACWPTRRKFARRKSVSGMAIKNRPSKTICSCSMRWTTVMAAWSTATPPH